MKGDFPLQNPLRGDEISREWDHDNQQWWNQYMASADNEMDALSGPAIDLPSVPPADGPLPTLSQVDEELNASYELDPLAAQQFHRDGYVKLKRVLSPPKISVPRGFRYRRFPKAWVRWHLRWAWITTSW